MRAATCTGIAAALALLAAASARAEAPRPAPPVFVSQNYGLTFRSPADALICPLPADWAGSDHGTVVFLSSPGDCGGVGFPSSGRNFTVNAPRIELYYQYWLDDPATPPPECRRTRGSINVMRKSRPLCEDMQSGMIRLSASAGYKADLRAWAEVSLVTTRERLAADLAVFRQVAGSVHACRSAWSTEDGKAFTIGTGPDCPKDGSFF
jgi:hypothetical protein